MSHPINNWR